MSRKGYVAAGAVGGGLLVAGVTGLIGNCTGLLDLEHNESGQGLESEVVIAASDVNTTLGAIGTSNAVELRIEHVGEVLGAEIPGPTDIIPAEVPGFLEFRMREIPMVTVEGSTASVTLDRRNIYAQDRTETNIEPISFTVSEGVLTTEGMPFPVGTPVGMEDGDYETGVFSLDEDPNIISRFNTAMGFNEDAQTTALRIGSVATMNPRCIEEVDRQLGGDEGSGLDTLLTAGLSNLLVSKGFQPDVQLTGEYPEGFMFEDESGETFEEKRVAVEETLRGGDSNNPKTISIDSDCTFDGASDTSLAIEFVPGS